MKDHEGPKGGGAPVGIGDSRGIPGAYMPIVYNCGNQAVEGETCSGTVAVPGTAGVVVAGVPAVFVAGCPAAGAPAQGRVGRPVSGSIWRADFIESAGQR